MEMYASDIEFLGSKLGVYVYSEQCAYGYSISPHMCRYFSRASWTRCFGGDSQATKAH